MSENKEPSKTRFTVGEAVVFVHIDFVPGRMRFGTRYFPWEDELREIKVVRLTCKEHHTVPGEWDDKPQHDGFVFMDDNGEVWHNQYPAAVYGQLDDSQNWIVHPKDYQKYPDFYSMEDVCKYMDCLRRGMKTLTQDSRQDLALQLQDHLDAVIEKVQELGYEVVLEPIMLRLTDGTTEQSSMKRHRLKSVLLVE